MDDLVLSGLAMYRATQNHTYLNDALQIYKAAPGLNNHSEPLDWDNKVYCCLSFLYCNNHPRVNTKIFHLMTIILVGCIVCPVCRTHV